MTGSVTVLVAKRVALGLGFAGLVAGFWRITPLAGIAVLVGTVAGVHGAGYVRAEEEDARAVGHRRKEPGQPAGMTSIAGLPAAPDRDAFLAGLAKEGPVSRGTYMDGGPIWLVTGYPESVTVLTDPRFSSDVAKRATIDVAAAAGLPAEFDLTERYAYPLPIQAVCELPGVPAQDRDTWRGWAAGLGAPGLDRMAAGARGLVAYMRDLIARERATPGDDLLSGLVRVREEDGDRLSDEELIAMSISILIAGHETTVGLISQSVWLLLTRSLVVTDVAAAVEELLRYSGPAEIAVLRHTLEPVELGGVAIPAGEAVQVVYAAANRDPRRFDRPGLLDLHRADNAHLGFGHGIHYRLGAALARAEAQIAFTSLFDRFPRLALAGETGWQPGFKRALTGLPVRTRD